ncbi:MAG: hypothetical protein NTZ90_17110 [Proteobacteria bacterium]|nr:hypothetical protein [Pseudomonadota bacterium]
MTLARTLVLWCSIAVSGHAMAGAGVSGGNPFVTIHNLAQGYFFTSGRPSGQEVVDKSVAYEIGGGAYKITIAPGNYDESICRVQGAASRWFAVVKRLGPWSVRLSMLMA